MTEEEKHVGPPTIYVHNKFKDELIKTAKTIGTPGKGILAADESTGTIEKRFKTIKLECNKENRRRYRELLFTTKDANKYISGVIMYDETIRQSTKDQILFPKLLANNGIIPGIKVDMGTKPLPGFPGETYTQGITDLFDRCKEYYDLGARFAKWRAVLQIQNGYISQSSIKENAWTLARYASICQQCGLAPIVEPEILIDGDHSLEVCQYWTEKVLSACYKALIDQEVILEGTILKPSMCVPGSNWKGKRSVAKNALATVTALKRTVPCAVPSINFLSGGQSEEEATQHLNEINKLGNLPWTVSFSFGRALQDSCLKMWNGKDENLQKAQDAYFLRAKANGMAQLGKYDGFACTEESKKSLFEAGYVY